MKATIRKSGNGFTLRIPKQMAEAVGINAQTQVELTVKHGQLVVTPLADLPRHTLATLLANFDPATIHEEIDTGAPTGKEIW